MTYYGAEKVVPKLNVMGVAKAALEANTRYIASDLGKRGIRRQRHQPGRSAALGARRVRT